MDEESRENFIGSTYLMIGKQKKSVLVQSLIDLMVYNLTIRLQLGKIVKNSLIFRKILQPCEQSPKILVGLSFPFPGIH